MIIPNRKEIKIAIDDLWASPIGKVAYFNLTINVFLLLMMGRNMFKKPTLAFGLILFLPFIFSHFKPLLTAFIKPSSFLLLFFFFCCSFAWSTIPALSIDRISTQIGFVALAYLAVARYRPEAFFKCLQDAASISVVLAVLFCAAFPGSSYTSQGLQSFYPHKNMLGLMMALNAIVLLMSPKPSRLHIALGLTAIALILASFSKTSISLTLICFVVPQLIDWVRSKMPPPESKSTFFDFVRIFSYSSTLAFLGSIVIFREDFINFIWSILDKDLFTGRGTLWITVLQQIRSNSLLGIGPGSFWQAEGKSEIAQTTLYQLNDKWVQNMISADGSYIDLLASIGTVGLALFLLTVVDFYRMALRNWDTGYVKVMFALVTFVLFHGITESTILYSTNILWFVYVCCYVRVFLLHSMNSSPTPWQRLWGSK